VSPIVGYLLVFALPTAVGFAIIGALRAARWLGEARRQARYQAPHRDPIERLQADLRRLRAELEDTENQSGLTAKYHRVQALRGAYARDPARDGGRSRVTAWSGGDRSGRTRLTGAGTGQQALAAERSPLEFRAMLGISIGSGQPDGIAS